MSERRYVDFKNEFELPKKVVSDGLYFDSSGLCLTFKVYALEADDGRSLLNVKFSSNPFLLRVIDEGDYLSTPGMIPHWLCEVENSELLAWFNSESLGVREGQGLIHYAIYTPAMCYDIIHCESPVIYWS